MLYTWQEKFKSGEYISEWNGYTPDYAGCFYGNSNCLGGEEKFRHCYDFFSGVGDVEWWIKAELDKLTDVEQSELLSILKRNKETNDFITKDLVKNICREVGIDENDTCIIYRLGNKKIMELYNSSNKKQYLSELKDFEYAK